MLGMLSFCELDDRPEIGLGPQCTVEFAAWELEIEAVSNLDKKLRS